MVAFEAWLKGWRSGMLRTPNRNVESSNLAGTSELDVILAHVFLVEVRGRGIWSRAGEQVKNYKKLPLPSSSWFLSFRISSCFFLSFVNFAYYSMSDNDFISTLFPGQGVLYLGWLGPLITPFPCLPLSKLGCSTCTSSPQVACFPAIHPGKTGQGLSLGKWVLLRYGPSGDPSDPVCNALWNLT